MGLSDIIRRFTSIGQKRPLENALRAACEETRTYMDGILIRTKIELLRDKTLNSQASGILHKHRDNELVIVSLTTFGERIHNAYLPIESIMQGTMKPDKIILWLAKEEFEGKVLPITLQKQQSRGLEIRFIDDLKSYNKLIPALKTFPDDTIVTIDDDALYEFDLLERLYSCHQSHPNTIYACRMHRIRTDTEHSPIPYMQWDLCIDDERDSILNFPTGIGGVLYPPHCFTDEVFNSKVFMSACPKADDIWFYAMARIANTSSKWVRTSQPKGYYIPLPITDDALSLYNTSPTENGNDLQLKNVMDRYNISMKV